MKISKKVLRKIIKEEVEGAGSEQSAIYDKKLHMEFISILSDLQDAQRPAQAIQDAIHQHKYRKEESYEYAKMLDKIQGAMEYIWRSLGEDPDELFKIREWKLK